MKNKKPKFWTRPEERRLVAIYNQRRQIKEIAEKMGRTPRSIDSRLRFLAEEGRVERWFPREKEARS